jgi:hypothetical protein
VRAYLSERTGRCQSTGTLHSGITPYCCSLALHSGHHGHTDALHSEITLSCYSCSLARVCPVMCLCSQYSMHVQDMAAPSGATQARIEDTEGAHGDTNSRNALVPCPSVYAVGDCAGFVDGPLPALAQVHIRFLSPSPCLLHPVRPSGREHKQHAVLLRLAQRAA